MNKQFSIRDLVIGSLMGCLIGMVVHQELLLRTEVEDRKREHKWQERTTDGLDRRVYFIEKRHSDFENDVREELYRVKQRVGIPTKSGITGRSPSSKTRSGGQR